MKTNPILEEVWRIKDELSREAGDDIHRLCANTRKWAEEHGRPGPVIRNRADMLQLLAEQEKRVKSATMALKEEPRQPKG